MAKYNIHAGHNPHGKVGCGAIGFITESTENRLVAREIIRLLTLNGHTVHDCTVNNGVSQNDILSRICKNCNLHKVTGDYSIHFNAGRKDKKGDKKIGGFEIWITNPDKAKEKVAARIRSNMKALGFTDRGTKVTNNLYYLNAVKNKTFLLEICFVDDKDDCNLYKKVGYEAVAEAVVKGILNKKKIKTEEKKPKVKKKTILQIAKEVIAGKYGNGEERRAKLIAEGYDPDKVQKKVNKLLK